MPVVPSYTQEIQREARETDAYEGLRLKRSFQTGTAAYSWGISRLKLIAIHPHSDCIPFAAICPSDTLTPRVISTYR